MLEKALLGGWEFMRGKMIWLMVIVALLIIPFGYAASSVGPDTNLETNIRKGSDDYNTLMELKRTFSDQNITILVKGKTVADIVSDQNLAAMKSITEKVNNNPKVAEKILFTISPAFFWDYLQDAGQVPEGVTPAEYITSDTVTGEPLQGTSKRGGEPVNHRFTELFMNTPEAAHALIALGMWDTWDADETDGFIKDVERYVEEANFDDNVEVTMSGLPIIMNFMAQGLAKTMGTLLGIGFLLMLIVLTFGFKVRGKLPRRWLTLLLVGISLIFTMGILGFTDVPLTNASVVVFPILLGLGVDYGLQFHNRYDEESRKGATADEGVKTTLRRTGPPIIMAMLLCMVGFASVFVVDHQQIFYFGYTLIIGVAVCMVIALMLLLGILYKLDKPKDATRKPAPRHAGPLERFMGWSVPRIVKLSIPMVIIGVIFSGIGWWQESNLESLVGFDNAVNKDVKEYQNMRYLQVLAGGVSPWNVIVKADNVLEPEILQWVLEKSEEAMAEGRPEDGHYLGGYNNLAQIFDDQFGGIPEDAETAADFVGMLPREMSISLINDDHTALSVNFNNTSDEGAPCGDSAEILQEVFTGPNANPPAIVNSITVTGLSLLGPIMDDTMAQSREAIMTLGIGLILALLLIMFRFNIKRVIAAAFPILLVLGWSVIFMKILDIKVSLLSALLPAQLMAIGIEFTILLLMRYYEERDKGEHPMLAMTTAMTRIGRAILVSAGMVFVGFFAMIFAFDFPFVQEFGIITMIDMVLIMLATLVVMPALVLTFDLRDKMWQGEKPLPSAEEMMVKE